MQVTAKHKCFGGHLLYVKHNAAMTNCEMKFTIFLPQGEGKFPALFYLAGLTCTEDTFTTKASAYKAASELGLVIIAPDTSPRGDDVADAEGWDIGKGAGFYLNATQEPWSKHYQMESYITDELYKLVLKEFPLDEKRIGIFGHSMGGHGALTLFLRNPELYKSVSAFAPICAPVKCPWGKKAFSNYLGETGWEEHDASLLMVGSNLKTRPEILIDQGLADKFLAEQLYPEEFEKACAAVKHPLTLRKHEGYDHGYFFIQTFMDDHLRHHAKTLKT